MNITKMGNIKEKGEVICAVNNNTVGICSNTSFNLFDINTLEKVEQLKKSCLYYVIQYNDKYLYISTVGKIYEYDGNSINFIRNIPYDYNSNGVFHLYDDWFVSADEMVRKIWKFNIKTGEKIKLYEDIKKPLHICKVENRKIYFSACKYTNDLYHPIHFYIMSFDGEILNSFESKDKWCWYPSDPLWIDDDTIILSTVQNHEREFIDNEYGMSEAIHIYKEYYVQLNSSGETVYLKEKGNDFFYSYLKEVRYKNYLIFSTLDKKGLLFWNYISKEIEYVLDLNESGGIDYKDFNVVGDVLFVLTEIELISYRIE